MDQELLEQLSFEATSVNAGFGSDEYFAARFCKADRRYPVWAVLALKSVIENIPLTVRDPGVARLKLAWWQNQSQQRDAHPLYRIAKSLYRDGELLDAAIDKLVTSLDRHYGQQLFESEDDREHWFSDSYHSIYKLLIPNQERRVSNAFCVPVESARSLLRLKDELNRQYVRLSKDIFTRENLHIATVLADPNTELMRTLIDAALNSANDKLEAAIKQHSGAPDAALTYALITKRQLEETIVDGGALLERKVELTPLRKLWIAWRSR